MTVHILKTTSFDNEKFYNELKAAASDVKEHQDFFICTPLPGRLMHLVWLLRFKNVPFEIKPDISSSTLN